MKVGFFNGNKHWKSRILWSFFVFEIQFDKEISMILFHVLGLQIFEIKFFNNIDSWALELTIMNLSIWIKK